MLWQSICYHRGLINSTTKKNKKQIQLTARKLSLRRTEKAEKHFCSMQTQFLLTVFLHSQHFYKCSCVTGDCVTSTLKHAYFTWWKGWQVFLSNKHVQVQHSACRHPAWCNLFYGQPHFYIRSGFTFVEMVTISHLFSARRLIFFFPLQIVTLTTYFLSPEWMTVKSSENTSLKILLL